MYVDNLVSDSTSGYESEDSQSEINYYSAFSSPYPALLSCSIPGKGVCSIGMDYKGMLKLEFKCTFKNVHASFNIIYPPLKRFNDSMSLVFVTSTW